MGRVSSSSSSSNSKGASSREGTTNSNSSTSNSSTSNEAANSKDKVGAPVSSGAARVGTEDQGDRARYTTRAPVCRMSMTVTE